MKDLFVWITFFVYFIALINLNFFVNCNNHWSVLDQFYIYSWPVLGILLRTWLTVDTDLITLIIKQKERILLAIHICTKAWDKIREKNMEVVVWLASLVKKSFEIKCCCHLQKISKGVRSHKMLTLRRYFQLFERDLITLLPNTFQIQLGACMELSYITQSSLNQNFVPIMT